jgi:hypothetical protein
MRVQTISYDAVDATGSSSALVMNTNISPFNVGFGVVVTGTVTYTVEHTFEDPANSFDDAVWFPHPTIASKSTDQDGNYAFPVSGIRITVTAGGGSVSMNVIQAGI